MSKKLKILLSLILFMYFYPVQDSLIENTSNYQSKGAFLIEISSASWEIDDQGTATYIVDGDTFDVNGVGRIRSADIDTPEVAEAGYQEAKDHVQSLIYNKNVFLDIDDKYRTDIYDRIVAVAYVRYNSTHLLNINKDLLDRSLAVIMNYDNEFEPSSWSLYVYYIGESGDDDDNDYYYGYEPYGILIGLLIFIGFVFFIYYIKKDSHKTPRDTHFSKSIHPVKDFQYNKKHTKLKGTIRAETNKALLINFGGAKNHWIPKQYIYSKYNFDKIHEQEFIIDDWILEERNKTSNLKFKE